MQSRSRETTGGSSYLKVVRELDLEREPSFTRCIECNTPLEPCTPEEAQPHVPPYVYRTQHAFLTCPGCNRYYWQGTHAQRMRRMLQEGFRGRGN